MGVKISFGKAPCPWHPGWAGPPHWGTTNPWVIMLVDLHHGSSENTLHPGFSYGQWKMLTEDNDHASAGEHVWVEIEQGYSPCLAWHDPAAPLDVARLNTILDMMEPGSFTELEGWWKQFEYFWTYYGHQTKTVQLTSLGVTSMAQDGKQASASLTGFKDAFADIMGAKIAKDFEDAMIKVNKPAFMGMDLAIKEGLPPGEKVIYGGHKTGKTANLIKNAGFAEAVLTIGHALSQKLTTQQIPKKPSKLFAMPEDAVVKFLPDLEGDNGVKWHTIGSISGEYGYNKNIGVPFENPKSSQAYALMPTMMFGGFSLRVMEVWDTLQKTKNLHPTDLVNVPSLPIQPMRKELYAAHQKYLSSVPNLPDVELTDSPHGVLTHTQKVHAASMIALRIGFPTGAQVAIHSIEHAYGGKRQFVGHAQFEDLAVSFDEGVIV